MGKWVRPARVAVAALLVAGLVGLIVYRSGHSAIAKLPPPPTTLALATPTTNPNLSGVNLGAVLAGVPSSPAIKMGPGTSGLVGTVSGPQLTPAPSSASTSSLPGTPTSTAVPPGSTSTSTSTTNPVPTGAVGPLPGATVEVDRFVGSAVATVRVVTASNGTWSVPNILGGQYQVRAWLAPYLALTTPQELFLTQGRQQVVNMNLDSYTASAISSSMAPNPPVVGEPAELVVSVGTQVVGNDGVVRTSPQSGAALGILTGSQTTVDSTNPVVADQNGQGAWNLTCSAPGAQLIQLEVNGSSPQTLSVPGCVAPAPPPTTSTTTSVTSTSSPTSSVPGG